MKPTYLKALKALSLSCALLSGIAIAQTSKGALTGVAKDSTGALLGNASVTIKGEQTGETRVLTTGADGAYRADALSPEPYTISATHEGFTAFKAEHVAVGPSTVTNYDVTLSIGSANDTVTVEADSQTLNTVNGQLAGTIASSEIAKLPILR